jgi:hypothetical protein
MGTKFAVPPMFFLTKLDEALILYKRKSGGSSILVRKNNGRWAKGKRSDSFQTLPCEESGK